MPRFLKDIWYGNASTIIININLAKLGYGLDESPTVMVGDNKKRDKTP